MDVMINAEIATVPEGSVPLDRHGNFYHQLLSSVGQAANYPPVADLLRRLHELEGQWVIASPIHWQATHNDAMVLACGDTLSLSEKEARFWFAAYADYLAPENMKLHYHDAHTWLLQCDEKPQLTSRPVHGLLNQSMMPELQGMDESFFWQRLLTESQMFLSTHPLNQARDVTPINGMWFWGDGVLSTLPIKPMVCDDRSLPIAQLLSSQVSRYQPSTIYKNNSLLLLDNISPSDLQDLQITLQHLTVRWYWNNLAYTSNRKSWLSRIWR